MATATSKRKVLIVEGKVKVLWETENGKKKKISVRNFVSQMLQSKLFGKAVSKLLVCLMGTDWEWSNFESLNELRCCLNGLNQGQVTMPQWVVFI